MIDDRIQMGEWVDGWIYRLIDNVDGWIDR